MVTGSPSLRRWHLDLGLAQVDSKYKRALTLYEQVLTSRNRILKRIREGLSRKDELVYWTDELLVYGQIVSSRRKEFFDFANRLEKRLGNSDFEYLPSEVSSQKLEEYYNREIASGVTLIGPHRDDFVLMQNNRNLAHFGSRGEQREVTVAFKLTQLEHMAKVLGKRPILLLDDVFSELDATHRQHVADVATYQQTFISTIELEEVPKSLVDIARILRVEDGKVS